MCWWGDKLYAINQAANFLHHRKLGFAYMTDIGSTWFECSSWSQSSIALIVSYVIYRRRMINVCWTLHFSALFALMSHIVWYRQPLKGYSHQICAVFQRVHFRNIEVLLDHNQNWFRLRLFQEGTSELLWNISMPWWGYLHQIDAVFFFGGGDFWNNGVPHGHSFRPE